MRYTEKKLSDQKLGVKRPIKKFRSGFDSSLQILFKKHREERLSKRLTVVRKDHNRYIGYTTDGKPQALSGHYAFVRVDGVLKAWPILPNQHNNTCHFGLADFAPQVEYAGEAEFEQTKENRDESYCKEFNNASGCYKPTAEECEQADLPVETFRKPNFLF